MQTSLILLRGKNRRASLSRRVPWHHAPIASPNDGKNVCAVVRKVRPIEGWPRLMTPATAAAYCDEASVEAFRRGIGKIWPAGKKIAGKGERWLREDLDGAIERLMRNDVQDAADLL